MSQWFGSELQKLMWGHLHKTFQCRLIGQPLQVEDLKELDHMYSRPQYKDFNLWISGDYSAATDNLKMPYTKASQEAVLRLLGDEWTEEEREILRSVIYEQILNYPRSAEIPEFTQKRGQLMGSILSFPNLCACNLVAYWSALESFLGRTIAFRDLPVLVNGDDILFKASPDFYEIWKSTIGEFGFELSMGKNYASPSFVMINSIPFTYTAGVFTRIPWLNLGLLTGQARVTGRLEIRSGSLASYYNPMIRGASNQVRAHFRFLQLHRCELASQTVDGLYNAFVDPLLGGLGFERVKALVPYIRFTPFQRNFGHFLLGKIAHVRGDINRFRKELGIVSTSEGRPQAIMRYHYGDYKLRSFHSVGSGDALSWTLVLGEEERLPVDQCLKMPLFVGERGDTVIKVVHPRESTLRQFRRSAKEHRTVKALLTCPRVYVETVHKTWEDCSLYRERDGVVTGNSPKRCGSLQEPLNTSVLNKTPRDCTALLPMTAFWV